MTTCAALVYFLMAQAAADPADAGSGYVRMVRTLEVDGIASPGGLAFSAEDEVFAVLDASGSGRVAWVSSLGTPRGLTDLGTGGSDPLGLA